MLNTDRILMPLNTSDFIDHEIEGVKVRIILEEYHQRFTRKCLYACSSSRMNLPSVAMMNSKELASLLLNSTQAKVVSYPTSIELDVTTNKVTTSDSEKKQANEHLQWLDVNTGRSVDSINWLQFADKMPFSPDLLDTIVLTSFAGDQKYSTFGLPKPRAAFEDNFVTQIEVIQLQVSSHTCQLIQKPVFSCFHDPTSYNARLIARQIDQIKNRECSLRVFCRNEKNETYKRKYEH